MQERSLSYHHDVALIPDVLFGRLWRIQWSFDVQDALMCTARRGSAFFSEGLRPDND